MYRHVSIVTTVYLCFQVWLQVKPCVSVAVVMSVRTHSLSVTCHSLAVYSTIVQHVVETQVNHIKKVRHEITCIYIYSYTIQASKVASTLSCYMCVFLVCELKMINWMFIACMMENFDR